MSGRESLHCTVAGDLFCGAAPIVLIHGLDSATPTFDTITGPLSQDRAVISVDQRGHGLSPDIDPDFSSERMAQDVIEVLNELGVERFCVLGHSLGARTATRLAEMVGDRCQALILEDMETRARRSPLTESERAELYQRAEQMRELVPLRYATREELAAALQKLYGIEGAELDSLISRRARETEQGEWELLFRPWSSLLYSAQSNSEDLNPVLAATDCPALAIRALCGGAVTDQGWEQMRRVKPEMEFYEWECGHTIHRERAEATVELISEFLARHGL